MADKKLTGMGVALITPFKQDESIDYDALARLVEHLLKNQADYLRSKYYYGDADD